MAWLRQVSTISSLVLDCCASTLLSVEGNQEKHNGTWHRHFKFQTYACLCWLCHRQLKPPKPCKNEREPSETVLALSSPQYNRRLCLLSWGPRDFPALRSWKAVSQTLIGSFARLRRLCLALLSRNVVDTREAEVVSFRGAARDLCKRTQGDYVWVLCIP